MAVTTKKQFPNAVGTNGQSATVFTPVGIQLNNQDDLDVYVTLSGGTRVLQLRQSTGSTAQSSHPQVNNTDGLYFPAVSAGTTLYNYQLSTDNNTITFNSALPTGATVFVERRTRDADSSYTTFASGSTIRATDLNNSSTESNFTAQDGRNKAFTIEGVLFNGDQPSTNFVTSNHIVDGSIVNADINASADIAGSKLANLSVAREKLQNDAIDGTKLADNAVNSEHYTDGSIDHVHLANDIIDGDNIQDSVINSEHYVAGSIDHVHLANDIIDGDNIQDDVVDSEHIAAGALDNEHYAAGSITSDKLNGATVVTNSEQAASTPNDTSFFTTAAAEARYFNASTGETIKDGQAFPDNDTTIATTAAINDRIIDLVDDVGGFVPIANETSFPTSNPDINNGSGTLVSIKSISSTRTPSSGTVTIANGAGTGNTVSITGCGSTVLAAGFGIIVETTSTLHTYAFHRLVPKATEVTTVAGKATEIGRLGTAAAVEDMSILGTAETVADMAILGTADVVNDLNVLGTADVVADLNTLGTADVVNDMNILGTSANVTAMSNCSGSISSINNASSNLTSINNFGDTYQVAANNPSTDGGGNALAAGDLYFNTSANELKVYNGSAWQGGVTATGNFAVTTGNTFTGDNRYNDGVKAFFGTGNDLEVYHNGTNSHIDHVGTGDFFIRTVGSGDKDLFLRANNDVFIKPQLNENGISAIGNGQVELYYDGAKKFETTSTGAYVNGSLGIGTTSALDKIEVQNGAVLVGHTTNATAVRTLLQGYGFKIGSNLYGNVSIRSSYNHNSNSGSLDFYTASGGTNTTERVKITSDGHLQVYGQIQIPNDLGKITLGTSQDLEIFHDGAHSRIKDVGTGGLLINASEFAVKSPIGENVLRGVQNDAAELYYDGGKKLETRSTGIYVSGLTETGTFLATSTSEFRNNVKFEGGTSGVDINFYRSNNSLGFSDNAKLKFGGSGDVEVYHDGTNTYFKNSTGDLILRGGGGNILLQAENGEQGVKVKPNSSVELYHNNLKKFESTSDGCLITDSDNSAELQFANAVGSGGKVFANSTTEIGFKDTNNHWLVKTIKDGAAELYHDNSKKLETTATGATVTGSFNATGDLRIDQGSTVDGIVGLAFNTYFGLKHTDQTLNSEYMIISKDTDTFISASTGSVVRIRNGGNDQTNELIVGDGVDALTWRSNKVFHAGSNINLPDNTELQLGTSQDLKLYHDGSNSYIQHGTVGNLRYQSGNHDFYNQDGTEFMCRMFNNGSVNLYYDNALKFRTSSIGTTTDGNAVFNGVTGGNSMQINLPDGNTDSVLINGGANQGRTVFRIQAGNATSGSATGMRWANSSGTDIGQIFINNDSSHLNIMNTVQGNDIRFHTSSSENSSGSVHVASISNRGSVQALGDGESRPAFAFTNDTDSGMYKRGNNNIGFSTAGVGRYFMGGTSFSPVQDNAKDLGSANNRWDDVRATNPNIATSDRNEKNTIVTSDLGLDFINKLSPVSYKWNKSREGVGKRTHYGLIAQDIETVLGTINKSATDFAGFCKDRVTTDENDKPLETPVDRYGLRYAEFIAPMIKAIQELSTEVNNLKTKVAALEAA